MVVSLLGEEEMTCGGNKYPGEEITCGPGGRRGRRAGLACPAASPGGASTVASPPAVKSRRDDYSTTNVKSRWDDLSPPRLPSKVAGMTHHPPT